VLSTGVNVIETTNSWKS